MAVFPTNAILAFKLPVGDASTDSIGNPATEIKILTVEASLSEKSDRRDTDNSEYARRVDTLHIKGRVNRAFTDDVPPVEYTPPRIPPEIRPGVKVPCTLRNLDTDEELAGEFIFEISLPSKWGVDKVLGGQMNGYFFIKTAFGGVV